MKRHGLYCGLLLCGLIPCVSYGAENQLRVAYYLPESIQTFVDEFGATVTATDMDLNVDWADMREYVLQKAAQIYQGNTTLGTNTYSGFRTSIEHFESLGWKVNIYGSASQQNLVDSVLENNDVIINAEYNSSGDTVGQIVGPNQILPLVDNESFHLDDWKLSTAEGTPDSVSTGANLIEDLNVRYFKVVKQHPIVSGLPEQFAPLIEDATAGNGKPYIANITTLTNIGNLSLPDKVLVVTVDPVIPDQTLVDRAKYVEFSGGELPVCLAFEPGETPNPNKYRFVYLGYGTEQSTGQGLVSTETGSLFVPETHAIFQDGSTPGVMMLNYLNENGNKLFDNSVLWVVGRLATEVDEWTVY